MKCFKVLALSKETKQAWSVTFNFIAYIDNKCHFKAKKPHKIYHDYYEMFSKEANVKYASYLYVSYIKI